MKHRRRKHRERVSHERWLVSYADFITLLFAFFVVMYSTAQVDKKKVGQLAAAIQVAFQQLGAFPPSASQTLLQAQQALTSLPPTSALSTTQEHGDLAGLQKELEQALAQEISQGEITLHIGLDGLVVSLREAAFFDSGSAGIKPSSEAAFGHLAAVLGEHKYDIRIEGHTDNTPIHNAQFASNWELSTARATNIIRLFITQYHFAPERLSAAGYGEYHPIASNSTEEGRSKNRRVDMVVLRTQPERENPQSASGKPSPSTPK